MTTVQTFSEVGGHAVNEDAFAVRVHPRDPSVTICFVADGQGGQPGGGPASELACSTGIELAVGIAPERLTDERAWAGIMRAIDEVVRADAVAGLTTLVGLCVTADRVVGASCGDSAAVLVSGEQSTTLTEGQRKNPPIGFGSALPTMFTARLVAPWRLILVTDGVWKYVGWLRMDEIVRRDHGAGLIDNLQRAARLPATGRFQDDFTVVLVEPAA